ncbi:MAG: hypothetical protein WDN04_13540 [Rhodospirillales bacterium]
MIGGPADPGRLIALSPRAAALLLLPAAGVARVRVQLDTQLSHRVVDQVGGGPKLAISTAPAGTVVAEALPPLGAGGAGHAGGSVVGGAPAAQAAAMVPDRLPEVIHAVPPEPGQLWLRAGVFRAVRLRQCVGGAAGRTRRPCAALPRGSAGELSVRAGPFATVAEADAALRRALGAGVVDARITVEAD